MVIYSYHQVMEFHKLAVHYLFHFLPCENKICIQSQAVEEHLQGVVHVTHFLQYIAFPKITLWPTQCFL